MCRCGKCVVLILALLLAFCGRVSAQKKPDNQQTAIVRGQVTAEDGTPLQNALVRVAIPATDMRTIRGMPDTSRIQETETDKQGRFSFQIAVKEPTELSFDALCPGYRSAAGTLAGGSGKLGVQGGDRLVVNLGHLYTLDFELTKALYVAGTVVNEFGRPVHFVGITAAQHWPQKYADLAITWTDAEGRFEIFDFPKSVSLNGDKDTSTGQIELQHPRYVTCKTDDVYQLDDKTRSNLKIVLPSGVTLAGRLESSKGKPVSKTMVEWIPKSRLRKATMTDADGNFALSGLALGEGLLVAHAMKLKEKVKQKRNLDNSYEDEVIRLTPVRLEEQPSSVDVLGLKLATANNDLKKLYDLETDGVVVLGRSPESSRLKIGDLAEGDEFFVAGTQNLTNLRDFLDAILKETESQAAKGDTLMHCRVVYNFRRTEICASNTQQMEITAEDRKSIQAALTQARLDVLKD